MRKILLAVALIGLGAAGASAQLPPPGYLGNPGGVPTVPQPAPSGPEIRPDSKNAQGPKPIKVGNRQMVGVYQDCRSAEVALSDARARYPRAQIDYVLTKVDRLDPKTNEATEWHNEFGGCTIWVQ